MAARCIGESVMLKPALDIWLGQRMGWPLSAGFPSPQDVRIWQMSLLRQTIRHVQKHSTHYARTLAGISACSIQDPQEMAQLPFTTPAELRANPDAFLCVPQDEIARTITLSSSGTSGTPKRLSFTDEDLRLSSEFFHYGMWPLLAPKETVYTILPGTRPGGVGDIFRSAIAQRKASAIFPADPQDIPQMLAEIRKSSARALLGPPAHVFALAQMWSAQKLPKNQIRAVLMCWDSCPAAAQHRIREAFGCDIYQHWGMTETCLGGAVESLPGQGMNIREPDLFLEIIDPATGALCPEDCWGELVLSTLSRKAMPLLRYRTGDRARILSGFAPRGTHLRRLELGGRLNAGVPLANGARLTQSMLDDALLPHPKLLHFSSEYSWPQNRLSICPDLLAPTPKAETELRDAILQLSCCKMAPIPDIHIIPGRTDGTLHAGFEKRTCVSTHTEVQFA